MIGLADENLAAAGQDVTFDLVLADAGYCSDKNLADAKEAAVDVLVATGRMRRNERVVAPKGRIPKGATARQLMARRLRTKVGRADYARRKAIVEPAFGQMKVRQRAGQLRLRGLEGANGEWTLHAICHNPRKLANASPGPGPMSPNVLQHHVDIAGLHKRCRDSRPQSGSSPVSVRRQDRPAGRF